jgi:hypothetical protein
MAHMQIPVRESHALSLESHQYSIIVDFVPDCALV